MFTHDGKFLAQVWSYQKAKATSRARRTCLAIVAEPDVIIVRGQLLGFDGEISRSLDKEDVESRYRSYLERLPEGVSDE
jgi:hypothetical protein